LRNSGSPGMTKIEIGDAARDARFGLDGREDLLAILGRKNLTREAPMISHGSQNQPTYWSAAALLPLFPLTRTTPYWTSLNKSGREPAVWQAPRPKSPAGKDGYLSFLGGLSSFAGFAGFGGFFFSACCCCLSFASSASCFFSRSSSCCWCC
jgi:hypothetical protein